MILIDTSIWIDHLRSRQASVDMLLRRNQILSHPFVSGEIALGILKDRDLVLDGLSKLPQAPVAGPDEFLLFIQQHSLMGSGVGFVDAHLLATAKIKQQAQIWTRDKRLAKIAVALGVDYQP